MGICCCYVSSNCNGRNSDCKFISTGGPETTDSPQSQARHYKVLQNLYKSRPRPNNKDVAQLLDLEYQARQAYIDSDVMKEQDRPAKILQAYPCFREVDHVKSNHFTFVYVYCSCTLSNCGYCFKVAAT